MRQLHPTNFDTDTIVTKPKYITIVFRLVPDESGLIFDVCLKILAIQSFRLLLLHHGVAIIGSPWSMLYSRFVTAQKFDRHYATTTRMPTQRQVKKMDS